MRRQMLGGAIATAGLMLVAGTAHAAKAIKWEPSFKAAMAKARTSNKLVMVDFYTEW